MFPPPALCLQPLQKLDNPIALAEIYNLVRFAHAGFLKPRFRMDEPASFPDRQYQSALASFQLFCGIALGAPTSHGKNSGSGRPRLQVKLSSLRSTELVLDLATKGSLPMPGRVVRFHYPKQWTSTPRTVGLLSSAAGTFKFYKLNISLKRSVQSTALPA
jgi:hypothetical protein